MELEQCARIMESKKKKKENKEAEKAIDEEDELVHCNFVDEKAVHEKRKGSFIENVKRKTLHAELLPFLQKAILMCTIKRQSFCIFMKNNWIGSSDALCHITNKDTGLYDVWFFDNAKSVTSQTLTILSPIIQSIIV